MEINPIIHPLTLKKLIEHYRNGTLPKKAGYPIAIDLGNDKWMHGGWIKYSELATYSILNQKHDKELSRKVWDILTKKEPQMYIQGKDVDATVEVRELYKIGSGNKTGTLLVSIATKTWQRDFQINAGDTISIKFDPHSLVKELADYHESVVKRLKIADQMCTESIDLKDLMKLRAEYIELMKIKP